MLKPSRREFINRALGGVLLSSGAGTVLSCAPGFLKVHTRTGATQVHALMPSIRDLPEIYDADISDLAVRREAPVAVIKSANAEEAAYEVLSLLNPPLRSGRAFLKVNYSTYPMADEGSKTEPREWYFMAATQPEFTFGVIRYLHERGIKYEDITVGDGIGGSTTARLEFMGYFEMKEKLGIRVADLTLEPRVGFRIRGGKHMPEVGIAKVTADHLRDGVVVSIPKLKTHNFATVTLSVKNMMGCIQPPDCRHLMHQELEPIIVKGKNLDRHEFYESLWRFSERLMDFHALAPDFSVVDGIIGGEGHGVANKLTAGGDEKQVTFPVESHRAFAGTNCINVDAICAYFMGHNPMIPSFETLSELKFIPWLYLGQKKDIGYMYVNRIKVLGNRNHIEPEYRFRLMSSIEQAIEFPKKES